MELIIKETGRIKKETCKQEPVFKIEDSVLISCELNGCTAITIPANVKTIGKMCFASTDVEEVILPEGIKCIESKAFADCFNFKKINFPEGLESVKDRAFMNCGSLVEVILPTTLTKIGDYAFHNAGIEQLTLPDPKNVLSTGISVFSAIKVKNINVPKNFRLNKAMFSTCQQLRSVNFEADWVTIPERCFYYCTNLVEIDISKALFIKDAAFLECYSLSVNVIPAYTCVSACAFMKTGVENVTIEDISKVGEKAFSDCKSLKKLTINVPDGPAIATDLFIPEELAAHCTSLQTVTFTGHTENLSSIKTAAFRGTTMLKEISLPDSIRTIEQCAFCNSGIKNIHLPEDLRQIGNGAFASSGIKSIVVPDRVTKLGRGAFSRCYELTDVTLPESITTIPRYAFIDCGKLKTVNIPNVTVVCDSAFCNCKMLTAFDFSQVKELGSASFAGTGIRKAVLSNKLTNLQPSTFCNCKNLQSVDMSACDNVKTISTRCFEDCNELTDIKLPLNVHKFADGCFESVKFNSLVIKAGMRIDYYALSEAIIDELEFADDTDSPTRTVVNISAFEGAKVGRLIIPDHMYGRFKKAISQMQ
jgi:hypothetical protein